MSKDLQKSAEINGTLVVLKPGVYMSAFGDKPKRIKIQQDTPALIVDRFGVYATAVLDDETIVLALDEYFEEV